MESTTTRALLLLVTLVVVVTVMADDGTICGISQEELMKCKPAAAIGFATPPPPTEECCAALKDADMTCFCTFKNDPALPFLGISGSRAMQLPSKCDPTKPSHC